MTGPKCNMSTYVLQQGGQVCCPAEQSGHFKDTYQRLREHEAHDVNTLTGLLPQIATQAKHDSHNTER